MLEFSQDFCVPSSRQPSVCSWVSVEAAASFSLLLVSCPGFRTRLQHHTCPGEQDCPPSPHPHSHPSPGIQDHRVPDRMPGGRESTEKNNGKSSSYKP